MIQCMVDLILFKHHWTFQSIVYISSTRTVPATSHGPHPPACSHGHVQGWARAEILNAENAERGYKLFQGTGTQLK